MHLDDVLTWIQNSNKARSDPLMIAKVRAVCVGWTYVGSLTTLAPPTNRVFSLVTRGLPDVKAALGTLCCGLSGPGCPLTWDDSNSSD